MLKKTGEHIRRRVAVLLAVLMALSCLPAPALADEQPAEEPPAEQMVVLPAAEEETLPSLPAEPTDDDAAEVIASGTCGENLTWTLDGSGVLTISGEGEMDDWQPWHNYQAAIKSAVIEIGVTKIGWSAFSDCTNLESVIIPSSVSTIGGFSFNNCTGITAIQIPDGVISIEDYAFHNCTNLESFSFPDSLTTVGNAVFKGCERLANQYGFVIFDSVLYDYIGMEESLEIPEAISTISTYAFEDNQVLKSVTIPTSVRSILGGAFEGCDALAEVNYLGTQYEWRRLSISSGNNALFDKTIIHCTDGEIDLFSGRCGASLTWTLNDGIFKISGTGEMSNGCSWDNYKNLIKSVEIEDGVTTIGWYTFFCSVNLESVTIPDSVTSIGGEAFYGCSRLESLDIPAGVEKIEAMAFYHCSSIKSLTISKDFVKIGSAAFKGCSGLADRSGFVVINGILFDYVGDESEIVIPEDITSMSGEALYGCSKLTSVTIPQNLTEIVYAAFGRCTALKSVTLPDSISKIGDSAFFDCRSMTEITVPKMVEEIGKYAFGNCKELSTVYYAGSREKWDRIQISDGNEPLLSAAIHCSDGDYTVPASGTCGKNLTWTLVDGVLTISGTGEMYEYSSSGNMPWDRESKLIKEVIIEDGVTGVAFAAFYYCSNMTDIEIPASVMSINSHAFFECSSLTNVYYAGTKAEWNTIRISGDNESLFNAAIHCSDGDYEVPTSGTCGENLTWTLVDGVLTISGTGEMDYYDWGTQPWHNIRSRIESVVIEDGVTSIGGEAFSNCSNLVKAEIPDSVETIWDYAFESCYQLTDLTIPDEVGYISDTAFRGCNGLADENGFVIVNSILFNYCGAWDAKQIAIPDGVSRIAYHAFNYREMLSVMIPASVKTIGYGAFDHCDQLKEVFYSGTAAEWEKIYIEEENDPLVAAAIHCADGDYAVPTSGACGENLTWTLEDGVLTVSGEGEMDDFRWEYVTIDHFCYLTVEQPWYNARNSIHTVILENGVTSIGGAAFQEFNNLTEIMIPDTVTDIGWYAFRGCGKLQSIALPDTVAVIAYSAFSSCSGLTEVRLPDKIESIEHDTFSGCRSLSSIAIPNTVTSIGEWAFDACEQLKEVDYSGATCDWERIQIDFNNEPLYLATIHCTDGDYTAPTSGICGENLTWTLEGGVLTISGTGEMDYYDWGTQPWFNIRSRIESVVIEDGVTSIGGHAFSNCSNLVKAVIPDSVETIWDDAFGSCYQLTELTIPDEVGYISDGAFRGCNGLADENGFVIVNSILFNYYGSQRAKQITIPDGVGRIAYDAINYHEMISVVIPASVKFIGYGAFNYCNRLKEVFYSGTVAEWREIQIEKGNNLLIAAAIHCADGDYDPYSGTCGENLTWKLEDGVLTISGTGEMDDYDWMHGTIDQPWYNVRDSVHTVILENGVTRIGGDAFRWFNNLTDLTIPDTVTDIGDGAFKDCGGLADENGFVIVNAILFDYIGQNSEVIIPDGVNRVCTESFDCSANLKSIKIPESITSIVYGVFAYCQSLESISLSQNITSIGDYAFNHCESMTYASFSKNVTEIGENAFNDCHSLSDVYFFGSEEDWNSIAIDRGNDCLTNAAIHYITASEIEPLTVEGNTVTALIAPVCDAADRPTAWCAGYDSAGRMLWVKQKSLTANQMNKLTFDLEDGTASVKVMALTGDFVPLCTPQDCGV